MAGGIADESPADTGMFRTLRNSNLRLLLAGQLMASSSQWMEQVSRGWLVYEMTDSALLLGLVQATRALPMLLFGLIAGVVADRYDRQRQIVIAQNANVVLNVVLGALVITGNVQLWHVFVTAFLAGSVMAFQLPARQSLVPSLVPPADLTNAIAMNSIVVNGTRTIGPAIAGVSVAVFGVGWSYILQGAMFLFASLWTQQMNVPPRGRKEERTEESWLASALSGLSYVRSNPTVFGLLLLTLVPILLAQPYQALAPVFARDVFGTGATGQGLLLAVPGVGSVIGATMIARMANAQAARGQIIGGLVAFGLGLIAFALSPTYLGALVALFIVGIASTSYRVVNQTMLQVHTDRAYIGRVMSIYFLQNGIAPLGSLLVGTMAVGLGAPHAVAIMGALTVAFAIGTFLAIPSIRAIGRPRII